MKFPHKIITQTMDATNKCNQVHQQDNGNSHVKCSCVIISHFTDVHSCSSYIFLGSQTLSGKKASLEELGDSLKVCCLLYSVHACELEHLL